MGLSLSKLLSVMELLENSMLDCYFSRQLRYQLQCGHSALKKIWQSYPIYSALLNTHVNFKEFSSHLNVPENAFNRHLTDLFSPKFICLEYFSGDITHCLQYTLYSVQNVLELYNLEMILTKQPCRWAKLHCCLCSVGGCSCQRHLTWPLRSNLGGKKETKRFDLWKVLAASSVFKH